MQPFLSTRDSPLKTWVKDAACMRMRITESRKACACVPFCCCVRVPNLESAGCWSNQLHGIEGAMDGGQRVWAPHPEEGYQLGLIVDVSTDTLTVDPLQGGKVTVSILERV